MLEEKIQTTKLSRVATHRNVVAEPEPDQSFCQPIRQRGREKASDKATVGAITIGKHGTL